MDIRENVELADYSTMRLGGKARYLADATKDTDIPELVTWARSKDLPFIVIGRGSNIVWQDSGYEGLVIVDKLKGREVISEDEDGATVRAASGENWDEFVGWTVGKNLSGLESLSLIPGTVGAAPVQNIGAYGGELSSVLVEVEAYDTKNESLVGILNESCGFDYRTSRFKAADKGRYVIVGIVVRLTKTRPQPPFYEILQQYLDKNGIKDYTPQVIRDAVIDIRRNKMPDPEKVSNNGSFFTNPFIPSEKFNELKSRYPDIKGWEVDDGRVKLAAGWLVEKAGFMGYHDDETGMATSDKTALVVINEHAKSTADLLKFKQKIVDKVLEMFDVRLEQEPELLP